MSVQILVGDGEENRTRHILIPAGSTGWDLLLVLLLGDEALLVLVAFVGGHLAGIDAGRDGVDTDLQAVVGNLGGEQFGEMDGGGLAGVVAEVMLRGLDKAGNGADVDHGSRVPLVEVAGFLEKGQEGGGHEEALGDIGTIGVGPIFHGRVFVVEEVLGHVFGGLVFGCLGRGADAGIVDQNAEALLLRLNLLDQLLDVLLGSDVGGDGYNFAGDVLPMCLNNILQLILCSADDVDFGPVDSKGLNTHESYTASTPRDQGNLSS